MNRPKLEEDEGDYAHWCPACKSMHIIPAVNSKGETWTFDGNWDQPTFHPSVNISWTDKEGQLRRRCHYFIKEGVVYFCGDCTHPLAGQSIPLPEIPSPEQRRLP